MALDVEAAAAAVGRLAADLGLDTIRTAWGIHDVVNENMAAAMRGHVAERNRDPRNYTLFAFGGAGPVHAVAVARKVGISEVIVPLGAGVTSALGLLTAPMAVDLVQSAPSLLSDVDWGAVADLLDDVEQRARASISLDDVPPDAITVERAVDMRYVGQAHEITVHLPVESTDPGIGDALRAAFNETYRSLYSVLNDSFDIEVLNWRVRVSGPASDLWLGSGQDPEVGERDPRPIWEASSGSFLDAPVHWQGSMAVGATHKGPMIVEQRETTAVIGATDTAYVDVVGNLVIEVGP